MTNQLPDPFLFKDGKRVCDEAGWRRRRLELLDSLVELEYGGLPPVPAHTELEIFNRSQVRRFPDAPRYISCRVKTAPNLSFQFILYLLVPPGDGPFPVVLTGDGCYNYYADEIAVEALRRGNIAAHFNRCEIVPDMYNSERTSGLYRVYPDGHYGALAAWAWGYHRCVDVLQALEFVDPARIAVIGHSRGGKTALLAGATDERIALTCANNSGCGGAGCFRWQGPESETLERILRSVPYWFGPNLKEFIGKEHLLPFDQHCLKALVAPRPLLTNEALGDLWANPSGTWQTHAAAREVYRFLKVPDKIGLWCRDGGHDLGYADWMAFFDFIDWHFRGKPPGPDRFYDRNPFPDLSRAYSWAMPE